MSYFSAVLDSCVLFPMYLRDTLLCAAEAGFYLAYWSQEILDGATRNLVNTGRMTAEKAINLEAIIKEAFPESIIEVPTWQIEKMTNHPGDRHVLAAAVEAKAEIIVTSNLKHFQENDLAPWKIKALSPDVFLTNLYELDSNLMMQVVRRQSRRLKKPPLTVNELLALLSEEAPEFSRRVRLHLESVGDNFEGIR